MGKIYFLKLTGNYWFLMKSSKSLAKWWSKGHWDDHEKQAHKNETATPFYYQIS
jgi:hypothetical protein